MISCIKWNVAYESREVMICLCGIVETVSLILCPFLGSRDRWTHWRWFNK